MAADTLPSRPARRPRLRLWHTLIAGGLVLAVGVPLAANQLTRKTVTLDVNGRVRELQTHARTVRDALHEANILLDPEDSVEPALSTPLRDGLRITVHKAFAIAVQADGSVRQVRTQETNPLDVLDSLAIPVGPHDVVAVNGHEFSPQRLERLAWNSPAASIRVVRGVAVEVIDNGVAQQIHTTQTDIGRVLDEAGVELFLADRVTPDLSAAVTPGMVIEIERSMPVTVLADGRQLETRALGPTVGDALAAIGLAPIGLDYTIPSLEGPLEPAMTIQLIRVTEAILSKDEPIPYQTVYQPDPDLRLDEERVIQPGVDGVRHLRLLVRYEDGREVERTVLADTVTLPPTPQMIAFGKRAP